MTGPRNSWYWSSLVNLHIDNHSSLVGKGHTAEELAALLRDIPVGMIQVSAFGAPGVSTFPTRIRPHPGLGQWDTLAVWRDAVRGLHKKFGVYINTRGLRLYKQHPEWLQLDARNQPKGRNNGLDVCCRPWPNGQGALEQVFLPLLQEIVSRYRPDAVWVDGDHARTPVCYCPGCRAAWKNATGADDPPRGPDAPDWPRWLRFEQKRFDTYRRMMAETIHAIDSNCLYTSNHSWRFRSKDPRSPPGWVDTLSGDLSHGAALRLTRLSAMETSPETRLPHDIMHLINRKGLAPDRVLQEGAVALSSGGAWFLWTAGTTILRKSVQRQARDCAKFVMSRRAAIGRTSSLNPVGVLLSETSWADARCEGRGGSYDPEAAEGIALALQDAGFGVDISNEEILRETADRFGLVVVVNQRRLDRRTVDALRRFVRKGGTVLLVGTALLPLTGTEKSGIVSWTGVRRRGPAPSKGTLPGLVLGAFRDRVQPGFRLDVRDAKVLARFTSGVPALVRRASGRGAVAYLNAGSFAYPGNAWLAVAATAALGFGPTVAVTGAARRAHLLFSLRSQGESRSVLHVVNLSSEVNGLRVPPSLTARIAPVALLPEVRLELAWPRAPRTVRAVPDGTKVASAWHDGRLSIALAPVRIHVAVLVEGERASPIQCLPSSVPPGDGWTVRQPTLFDFETWPVEKPVPDWIAVTRTGRHTTVTVSAETAASGRRCLKFADSAKAEKPFFPYLFFRPQDFVGGTVLVDFALRLTPGADVLVELREVENARDYPVGPSLRFVAGQGVFAGRPGTRPLMDAPSGEWRRICIRCPLGSTGRYDLTITDANGKERTFGGLPCRSKGFRRCGWVGFCSIGRSDTVFYLDRVRIERRQ
ncbi:MAG: hypothetical protein GXP31_06980 [Kiritimatiellaeota bacterium]|nr:hypothetical protein [Kiritimatiellota bacterium]